jgi:tetratricopeptide (TPR) repeat protein
MDLERSKVIGFAIYWFLFITCNGSPVWAQEKSDLSKFSNQELLGRAERTFLMRNFTASEKYYRELNERLQKQLSSLEPGESQKQIELEEGLVLAPFGLGHSLIYLHRYPEALQAIEAGLKIYPDWAENHASMLFFQDPLFTGPILSDLERLMKTSQDQIPWLVRGYIHFFNDEFALASKSFSQALSLDKGNSFATYFIHHIELLERQKPVADLEKFNKKETDKLPVDELINYGSSFFKKSDYSMAAKLFKRAIETKKDIPVVHIAYGDSLFALGKFDEATQAILKGLEIYPKYAESQINRRDFYGDPSEFDLQLQKLEKYVHKHPDDLNARFLLGYNYFFIQDYGRADEQFQAVLANKSLQSSARYLHDLILKFNSQKAKKPL